MPETLRHDPPDRAVGSSGGPRAGPDRVEGPPPRWRVLVSPPRTGAANMALDHALAERLRAGSGVLRIYRWARPTVSFGRNEPARDRYDPAAAGREGLDVVRRPTGGRAVLHHDELTYAVVAPVRAWDGLRGAYRTINRGLVAALRRLGVAARLADPAGRPPPPSAGPCFAIPAAGEVVAGGRKLVGSAQARIGRALLQHGSLPLSGTQEPLARIRLDAAASPPPPATLRSLLGSVPPRDILLDALVEGLSGTLGGRWRRGEPDPCEIDEAERLRERYVSCAWTWRR